MTIIKYKKSLKYYPYIVIEKAAVDCLLTLVYLKCNYVPPSTLIKMFEAFCDVTGHKVLYSNLQQPSFAKLSQGFIGAILSGDLLALDSESLLCNADSFYMGVIKINPHIVKDEEVELGTTQRRRFIRMNKTKFTSEWEKMKCALSPQRVEYWFGFPVIGRKGQITYLALQNIYESFSPEFSFSIHKLISENTLKRAIPRVTEYNRFFDYLVKNKEIYNEKTFQDPRKIDELFKNYCRDYFLKELIERKRNKNTVISEWNIFSNYITDTFISSSAWVKPISGQLPHIVNEGSNAKETNIREDEEGIEVKRKLLTDVPIQITDEQAIKLLFYDISTDLNTIESWAVSQSQNLYQRHIQGKKLALKGKSFTKIKKEFGNVAPKDDELICHLAATFKERGHVKGFDFRFQQRMNVADVMFQLGLPQNSNDLFPYKVLLTIEHPEITPGYLKDLELYDKSGNLAGFVLIDGVYWLTGYKDRKTPNHSEQPIKLSEKTAQLVKEIISITEPIRKALKYENNDLWRYLFINYSKSPKKKIKSTNISFHRSQRDNQVSSYIKFRNELKEFTNKRGEELDRFIWRISLNTIRASSAVIVYLDTQSIQEMSKALGHTNVTKDRLKEYLPEPILAFFQSRWVRIFQKAIICEAMKDSEYILQATKFEKMEDLHQFLTNHALKDIPKHVMNDNIDDREKYSSSSKNESYVYFSVDKGILISLMSLERAVKSPSKNKNISGYAKYWCKVSELITKEIERSNDRNLKSKLEAAKPHINPQAMENLIYATT